MRRLLAIAAVGAAACRGPKVPSAAQCQDAAAHIADAMRVTRPELASAGVDPAPDVTALCKSDGWSGKVVRCYRDATTPGEARGCSDQLTDVQREHARAMQEALYKRATHAGDDDPLAACAQYQAAIDDLDGCASMSEAEREQLRLMADQQRATWAEMTADRDDGAAQVARDCASALEAITALSAARGC